MYAVLKKLITDTPLLLAFRADAVCMLLQARGPDLQHHTHTHTL